MHRLLVRTEALSEARPSIGAAAERHLRVLRPRDGEEFELFDGRGSVRRVRYAAASCELVPDGPAVRADDSVRIPLVLFACVAKGSRWDWTIEKATELGVSRIVPVVSERTIVRIEPGARAAKRERWARVAEDAARQSDALWIPEVVEAVDFGSAVEMASATRCFAGAITTPPPQGILQAALAAGRPPVWGEGEWSAFIGPEGDFTPDELSRLLEAATPVSLGRTVLRTETAAVYALSVLAAVMSGRVAEAEGGFR